MHWFLFVLVVQTASIGVASDPDGRPRPFATEAACEATRAEINEKWAALGKVEGSDYILACLQDDEAERQSTEGAVSAPRKHSVVPKGDPA